MYFYVWKSRHKHIFNKIDLLIFRLQVFHKVIWDRSGLEVDKPTTMKSESEWSIKTALKTMDRGKIFETIREARNHQVVEKSGAE